VDVIVRETTPSSEAAEGIVAAVGGTVNAALDLIGGFAATIPGHQIADLEASPAIAHITLDATIQSQTAGWQDATNLGDYVPNQWQGSMLHTGYAIGVDQYWSRGYTGENIGVALIDTGVVPVEGLTLPGKVIDAADLSFESQNDEFRHMDTYGHGTHLAGIIAGRDPAAPEELTIDNAESYFLGMAPDAHIVNVKVGDNEGAVDVSQVIAAIDWVVQHKDDNGMNVRVINLSFGTDSDQDPRLDPLSFAVEQAWHHGIVVVVASGNDGNGSAVRNPATNPYVIAAGAYDHGARKGRDAQPIPDWSSCGTDRTVDFVAPGAHVVSLRSPGSRADVEHSEARVADRFFLGSGTSQAAAVVSGAVALVLDRNPEYSPDDVKSVLTQGAYSYRKVSDRCQGAGVINLHDTWWKRPRGAQNHTLATGLGSLEAARGTEHLEHEGVVLEGEQDIMGNEWDGASWSTASAAGASWSGGEWNGASWSGASWSGASWSGASWSGASWSGASWSGASWSGASWSGASWSGASWSGASWSGTSWAGGSWSGASWSGLKWE
jgi:serine protease AprX